MRLQSRQFLLEKEITIEDVSIEAGIFLISNRPFSNVILLWRYLSIYPKIPPRFHTLQGMKSKPNTEQKSKEGISENNNTSSYTNN